MHVRSLHPTSWLARRLGLSVSTIERLRAQGSDTLPPHVIIGRHSIRYDEEVVDAWIERRFQPPGPTIESAPVARRLVRFGNKLVAKAATT